MMETTFSKRRKIARASTNYFLIGNSINAIPHNKLPTLGTVLRHVLYLKETGKPNTSIDSCLRSAAEEVLLIWSKEGIKTITQNNAVQQLTKIWNNWKALNKSKTRRKDVGNKLDIFWGNLERLWNVGAVDAIEVIQKDRLLSPDEKQKDIEFYHDQQTKRKATMAGKNKVLQLGIQNMNERVEREYTRSRWEQLRFASVEQVPSTSIDISCSSSSEKCCSESAGEFECETDVPTSKSDYVILHAPKNLINNSEVAMVCLCGRSKLSDNAATMILSTFIKACGGDINDFCLSRSSTYRTVKLACGRV